AGRAPGSGSRVPHASSPAGGAGREVRRATPRPPRAPAPARGPMPIPLRYRLRIPLLHEEQPLAAAGHDDRAALEVRVVAPRAAEAGRVLAVGHRVEPADLARLRRVADVDDAQARLVVRLVHEV